MAALPEAFDANAVEPSQPREILPAGTYVAQIIESDVQPAKSGNGMVLSLTFEVLDGPHANRKLWSNLNILHSNTTAQEIAQRDFSAICHAVGQMHVTDTEALHFKPLALKVEVELKGTKGSNGYEAKSDRNVVKGYTPAGHAPAAPAPRAAPPAVQRTAPPVQQAAPAARPSSMPWKRTA